MKLNDLRRIGEAAKAKPYNQRAFEDYIATVGAHWTALLDAVEAAQKLISGTDDSREGIDLALADYYDALAALEAVRSVGHDYD